MSWEQEDFNELRWVRQALEEQNTLLANQNKLLAEIANALNRIYGGMG